jgi:hypothetical protein
VDENRYEKLLTAIHKVDKRVAVIEERLVDLPDIKRSLDNLKIKVAGVSATAAIVVTLATLLITKAIG